MKKDHEHERNTKKKHEEHMKKKSYLLYFDGQY